MPVFDSRIHLLHHQTPSHSVQLGFLSGGKDNHTLAMITFHLYFAFQKGSYCRHLSLVRLEVENSSQYSDLHGLTLYDKRFFQIPHHLKISFSFQINLSSLPCKLMWIFQGSVFIQPDFGSIRQFQFLNLIMSGDSQ